MLSKVRLETHNSPSDFINILHGVTRKNFDGVNAMSSIYHQALLFTGVIYGRKFDIVPVFLTRHSYVDCIRGDINENDQGTFIDLEIIYNPMAVVFTIIISFFSIIIIMLNTLRFGFDKNYITFFMCVIIMNYVVYDSYRFEKNRCVAKLCALTDSKIC